MGLGAIDYIIHCDRRPSQVVVTGIDQKLIDRAAVLYSIKDAANHGVELHYINSLNISTDELKALSSEGRGFDDVFVYAPVAPLIEQADQLLGFDGCLNFFCRPHRSSIFCQIQLLQRSLCRHACRRNQWW